MKINIDIDDSHEETRITIQAKEWTQELQELVNMINKKKTAAFTRCKSGTNGAFGAKGN